MIRTIIVDDEILSRIGLRSFLDGKEGIVVSGIFGEAAEAIKFLEENVIDIVLTDIEMSDMNGLEFIQHIREQHLASGVIIVSCHDDFSYAQQAISLGTDSYILKHSVTEEKLISEVKKVYEKVLHAGQEKKHIRGDYHESTEIKEKCIYRVGVLKIDSREHLTIHSNQQAERDMLVHLLEEIVARYQMGTLFAPYNREIFVLFQIEKEHSKSERMSMIEHWISLLEKNMRQYVSEKIYCGLSEEYENLADTRSCYEDALLATEQSFYLQEQNIFYYKKNENTNALSLFTTEHFMEQNWIDNFSRELENWMSQASLQYISSSAVKQMLVQNLKQLNMQIMTEYHFNEEFQAKRNIEMNLIAKFTIAKNSQELTDLTLQYMIDFQKDALLESVHNPLSEVLKYIEQHLEEKLTLPELADMSYMSVPSFCKRFKEHTGTTVTQYLNEKRIERARVLLKQQKFTLWEIAEMTGFSNANYLLRVFKKTTGQTISEYRKKFGIPE